MAAVRISGFLLILMSFSISPSMQDVSESEPLLRFKNSVNVTKGDLSSWKTGTDPCGGKWFGIYCQKGLTVSGIHVPQLGLSGSVKVDDLKALANLKTVRMDNNLLSGLIPNFSKLRGLKSLMISNNSFSGEIPDDFFKDMTKLKRLFLDNNKFEGNVPSSIMQLPNLEELYLQNNNFTGELPPLSAMNKNLKVIDLTNNSISGEIPESFLVRKGLLMKIGGTDFCGAAVDMDCTPMIIDPSGSQEQFSPLPSSGGTNPSKRTSTIMFVLTFVILFFVLVGFLIKRNKKGGCMGGKST